MRNPGEPYRQFLSIVLRKLDATLARVKGTISAALARLTQTPMN